MSLDSINIPNQIDSKELSKIKNQFLLRDRQNIIDGRNKPLPVVRFDSLSLPNTLSKGVLRGLSYPLQIENGTLKIESGVKRVEQAILEVLETRIGERVGNPFLGIRELLFETIAEDVEAQKIKQQLLAFIPYLSSEQLSVRMSMGEDGQCYVSVRYAVEGGETALVTYTTR